MFERLPYRVMALHGGVIVVGGDIYIQMTFNSAPLTSHRACRGEAREGEYQREEHRAGIPRQACRHGQGRQASRQGAAAAGRQLSALAARGARAQTATRRLHACYCIPLQRFGIGAAGRGARQTADSDWAARLHCLLSLSHAISHCRCSYRVFLSNWQPELSRNQSNQSNQQNVWRLCQTSKMSGVCAKPGFLSGKSPSSCRRLPGKLPASLYCVLASLYGGL
jgi:hypothetical protein